MEENMAYKKITKNVDKGVTKEMANAVMTSLYGSDEYLAKKAKAKKPINKKKAVANKKK